MKIKDITNQAIIATVYIVLGMAFAPISYMALQFRVAEALMILPFYSKKHTIGLTLGCLVTNMFSPLGMIDVVFGTAATFTACVLISKFNNRRLAPFIAAFVNGIIIAAELYFAFRLPILMSMASIFVSELIVVYLGSVAFGFIEKNGFVKKIISDIY